MERVVESQRFRLLEQKWGAPLSELLYDWHWKENLKHSEIGKRIGLPRPTVTRWFQALDIPSQPATRFTNLNLLNVGPRKTPPAKPKVKKVRPWHVNHKFFHTWSSDMAYILGFFCADGSMSMNPRGSHYITFHITDVDLLLKIKDRLGTGHKLSQKTKADGKRKDSWRIQIGSREIFERFLSLGITPRKAHRLRMPSMPPKYTADFIRGYFDGDGGVWVGFTHKKDRKKPTRVLKTTFTSCSRGILRDTALNLHKFAGTTMKKPVFNASAYRLSYSIADSGKIYRFMYNQENDLYLERKKIIFEKYLGA